MEITGISAGYTVVIVHGAININIGNYEKSIIFIITIFCF